MKMTSEETNDNDALLALTNVPESSSDEFNIPPFSMRSIILLEKINSPFVSDRVPIFDPSTGQQVTMTFDRWLEEQRILPGKLTPETHDKLRQQYAELNLEGQPVFERVIPSMEQVAEAFYVMLRQADSDIVIRLRDQAKWEQEVLEFTSTLTVDKLKTIAAKINYEMAKVNAAGGPQGPSSKKVTGPTPL
jgi:hypothetical protein